jgi:hypothetical protein
MELAEKFMPESWNHGYLIIRIYFFNPLHKTYNKHPNPAQGFPVQAS